MGNNITTLLFQEIREDDDEAVSSDGEADPETSSSSSDTSPYSTTNMAAINGNAGVTADYNAGMSSGTSFGALRKRSATTTSGVKLNNSGIETSEKFSSIKLNVVIVQMKGISELPRP
jgi:hypothetical protein